MISLTPGQRAHLVLADADKARIDAINRSMRRWRIVHRPLTDDCQHARKAFAVYSKAGAQVARYGSIDAAERSARTMEAW